MSETPIAIVDHNLTTQTSSNNNVGNDNVILFLVFIIIILILVVIKLIGYIRKDRKLISDTINTTPNISRQIEPSAPPMPKNLTEAALDINNREGFIAAMSDL